MCMFCRSLFVLLYFFPLAIVLSVLRYTDSYYPFGIFKLFLQLPMQSVPFTTDVVRSNLDQGEVYTIKQTNKQTNTISLINTVYGH